MKFFNWEFFAPFIVLLGLCVALGSQTYHLASLHHDNQLTFTSFNQGFDEYLEVRVAWRSRILPNYLAGRAIKLGEAVAAWQGESIATRLNYGIATYSAFWFFLIGLTYVIACRKYALFYLFGTFAALIFAYTPNLFRVYPWDLPSIYIFTLFVILYSRKAYCWLLLVIPIGMAIKEPAILLSFAFLFASLPKKERLVLFGNALFLSIAVKLAIDFMVEVPLPFLTMEYRYEGSQGFRGLYLFRNFREVAQAYFLPILVNSGTFLVFLLLPSISRTGIAFKVIGYIALTGLLLFALLTEYRVYLEMIPLALFTLSEYIYGNSFLKKMSGNEVEEDNEDDKAVLLREFLEIGKPSERIDKNEVEVINRH